MFAALLTTVLFSVSAVSGTRATQVIGGVHANFWRTLVAAALLGTYAHSFGQGAQGAAFPIFLLSGCVGFGIGDVALYQALPRIGSRLSILLVHCLAAPLAAFIEWLWLGHRLTTAQMLCGATILLGVSVALAPGEHLKLARRGLYVGVACGVLAAFGQGFGAVLSRKAYEVARDAGEQIDGVTAAYQRILAGLVVAVLSVVLVRLRRSARARSIPPAAGEWREQTRRATPWILLNGLSGPALGVSCFQWALATTPTGIVLPIVSITPLVVIPFARVFEGERPTPRSILGGVLAVLGVVALTLVS